MDYNKNDIAKNVWQCYIRAHIQYVHEIIRFCNPKSFIQYAIETISIKSRIKNYQKKWR